MPFKVAELVVILVAGLVAQVGGSPVVKVWFAPMYAIPPVVVALILKI